MSKPIHIKCRFPNEYRYVDQDKQNSIVRSEVPAGYIAWSVPFDTYDPITFTAPFVLTAPWADKKIDAEGFTPAFNTLDGSINRQSHEGDYAVVEQSGRATPLNPRGRTGLRGRGVLGRWGPNHAADPIVTRWKRDGDGNPVLVNGKQVLQFVSIQRRDTNQWAIPGGMVDPGEHVSVTLKREFMEEAMDSTTASMEDKGKMEAQVGSFFKAGEELYKGYVDDPRNTDNSWMETVAFLFHDDSGDQLGRFNLKAGDDAKSLRWTDLDDQVDLYASHKDFVRRAVEVKGAHWET